MADEISQARERRDAHRYRVLQAAAILKLFREHHGRAAEDAAELFGFAAEHMPPGPVDPFDVLSDDEIRDEVARMTPRRQPPTPSGRRTASWR